MRSIFLIGFCVAGLLLMSPLPLYAQAQQIRFETLTVKDGLSNGFVTSITQDHLGFMWFGTIDGLNRYDGYTFTAYRHDESDATSIASNYIESLLVDQEGTLWIGTYGAGLNKYDHKSDRFTHVRHNPDEPRSLSDDYITYLYEDHSGTLWIGTLNAGLNRYDRETDTFVHYRYDADNPQSLSDDNVRRIYEDRQGTLWIGTGGPWPPPSHKGGLNRLNRATQTFERLHTVPGDLNSLVDNRVWALHEDTKGTFWVGTWDNGLHFFDREHGTFTVLLREPEGPNLATLRERIHEENDPIDRGTVFIYEDASGDGVWIGSYNGGIDYYDRASGRLTRYQHNPIDPFSPNSDNPWTLYEDRQGTLWIGFLEGGIGKVDLRANQFTLYRHDPLNANNMTSGIVRAIQVTRSGELWIGTSNGLNRLDRATGTFTHFRHDPSDRTSLSHDDVSSILEDQEGTLWVGTLFGGLNQFDHETNTFTRFTHDPTDPGSISSNAVSELLEDRSGTLWVGTHAGINRFERVGNRFIRYLDRSSESTAEGSTDIRAVYEARDGTLWFGTLLGGLTRYIPEADDFAPIILPRFANITSLHEDDEGGLWIGSGTMGLFRFDPLAGTSESYHRLSGASVAGILGDDAGRLWISTDNGLIRLDPETGAVRVFGAPDGIQGGVFGYGSTHRSDRGELFFGGRYGLNAFYPEQIETDPYAPPVVLTGLRIAKEPVTNGVAPLGHHISTIEAITFTHRQNDFTFEFAGLNFSRPADNQYAYRLEGFDREWREAGTERTASYMNLPPGSYTFRVKASNYDGVWNEEGAAIQVTIMPPWWRTWWAYLFYGLLVAGGAFVADRIQRRRLTHRLREQNRRETERLRTEAAEAWTNYLQAENNRQTEELENARALQLSMLPSHVPEYPTVDIAAFMQTATEVGGDYYDFDVSDDETLTFAIGDATGHGLNAGTMVTAVKSLFAHLTSEPDPACILRLASQALRRMALPRLYMAFALGKLRGRELELAGAGMPPALLYRAATARIEKISLKGIPLGGPCGIPYHTTRLHLEGGDILLLMSDGFPELRGEDGTMMGFDYMPDCMAQAIGDCPDDVVIRLVQVANAWRKGEPLHDDLTFIVMRVKE